MVSASGLKRASTRAVSYHCEERAGRHLASAAIGVNGNPTFASVCRIMVNFANYDVVRRGAVHATQILPECCEYCQAAEALADVAEAN